MDYKDYYRILGVNKDAGAEDIRKTYRRLARRYHPDVNPNNKDAEERFKEINEAYEVLGDPEKRKKYDELGSSWQRYQQAGGDPNGFDWSQWFAQGGPGGGSQRVYTEYVDLNDLFGGRGGNLGSFSDFFQSVFGGVPRGARTQQRGGGGASRDIEQPVEVSLEEAYSGTARILQTGQHRLEVRIPAGVQTGSRVRVAGEGERGRDGSQAGDLYLVITVTDHPTLKREGNDLQLTAPVDLYTLVLGGEVTIQTLKGRVSLRIPPETKAGRTFRLRGQGMPLLRNPSEYGDLYIAVQAQLPQDLSNKEKDLFRQLAALRS
jgi:curved DNA-binding protein